MLVQRDLILWRWCPQIQPPATQTREHERERERERENTTPTIKCNKKERSKGSGKPFLCLLSYGKTRHRKVKSPLSTTTTTTTTSPWPSGRLPSPPRCTTPAGSRHPPSCSVVSESGGVGEATQPDSAPHPPRDTAH